MWQWIVDNKEWLFQGALVVIPVAIIGWIIGSRRLGIRQRQRGGRNSTNIQIGEIRDKQDE